MAWQTPKTNWAAADGVRDTDMNRIESNILELYNGLANATSMTVYVSTSGSDTTGAGTSANPYKTITKALSVIPKALNGRTVSISIGAGMYTEDVVIQNFTGGVITLTGSGSVIVDTILVTNSIVFQRNITVSTDSVTVEVSGIYVAATAISCGGVVCDYRSMFYGATTVTISNAATAVRANSCSSIFINNLVGLDNANGLIATDGSVISYGTNSLQAAVGAATRYGGRIYSGAQSNIPLY